MLPQIEIINHQQQQLISIKQWSPSVLINNTKVRVITHIAISCAYNELHSLLQTISHHLRLRAFYLYFCVYNDQEWYNFFVPNTPKIKRMFYSISRSFIWICSFSAQHKVWYVIYKHPSTLFWKLTEHWKSN